MKNEIEKLADLAIYLDGKGHSEEAHVVDHMLSSLAGLAKEAASLRLPYATPEEAIQATKVQPRMVQQIANIIWHEIPNLKKAYRDMTLPGEFEALVKAYYAAMVPAEQPGATVPAGPAKTIERRPYMGMGGAGQTAKELGLE